MKFIVKFTVVCAAIFCFVMAVNGCHEQAADPLFTKKKWTIIVIHENGSELRRIVVSDYSNIADGRVKFYDENQQEGDIHSMRGTIIILPGSHPDKEE